MAFLVRALAVPVFLSVLAGPALSGGAPGAPVPASRSAQAAAENAPDEILVTCREGLTDATCRAAIGAAGQTVLRRFRLASDPDSKLNRLYLVRINAGQSLDEALAEVRLLPEVEAAQPNYVYRVLQTPDDPYYYLQWGQENLGDNSAHDLFGLRGPDPRVVDADMDADAARDLYSAWTFDPIIVGVVDTGVDYDHSDLAAVIWINPGELPGNGVDDDSNGYADDLHGWDFVNDDNDPDDPVGHGTHVAGTVGAGGNNGTGVAGTAPNARLMPLRFVDEDGSGFTDDLIDGILYGIDNGARVLNISSGGGTLDPALQDAIAAAGALGVLVVASAGNETSDNDLVPVYPASFDNDNVVSVTASTPWRDLADFSNWGIDSVDIAAPGDEIISTTPTDGDPGLPETAYQIGFDVAGYPGLVPWSGTSMASPAVAGAAALVFGLGDTLWPDSWSGMSPAEQMHAVRDRILGRTERWASFDGKTATDGHLNLHSLVEEDLVPPEPCGPSLQIAARGPDSVTLRWMATGDDGSTGRANYYDLRYEPGDTIDFASATSLHDVWTPGPPGFFETYTLAGLVPDAQFTFGLQVVDNVGNPSALTALTVTTLPPVVPPPTVVLFEDRFDGDDCGNWDLVESWGCETDSLSDSPGADYSINNRASARLAPLSFEGAQAVEVAFDLAAFDYEEGWDYLYFQYSLDGTSWRTLGTYTGSAGGPQSFDLPMLAGQPAVWFRFLSLSDYVYSFDGARIDDFQVNVIEYPGCVDDLDCDDANVCTVDTCDITGLCYSTPIPGCEDTDADGVEDPVDNCLAMPNGPYGGTCVSGPVGAPCAGADDCFDGETYGICSLAQEDLDSDGDGDA